MAWVCTVCGTNNSDEDKSCFICETPRTEGGTPSRESAREGTCTLTARRANPSLLPVVGGKLTVPEEYNEIGEMAFKDRTDIVIVVLHSRVRKIRKSAFEGCVNLKQVVCPSEVKSIESRAFANCPALTEKPTALNCKEDAFVIDSTPSRAATPTRRSSSDYTDYSGVSRGSSLSGSFGGSRLTPPSRPSTPPAPSRPSTPPAPSRPSTPPAPSRPSTPPAPSRPSTPPAPSRPSTPPAPSRPVAARAPVRVGLFFGSLFLVLGCWLTIALALVTLYLVFGKEWTWDRWQWILGSVGGLGICFCLYAWILSMVKCGFAKTGNVFGGIVIGVALLANLFARFYFRTDYEIPFMWVSGYLIVVSTLLCLPRGGRKLAVAYIVEAALIAAAFVWAILCF